MMTQLELLLDQYGVELDFPEQYYSCILQKENELSDKLESDTRRMFLRIRDDYYGFYREIQDRSFAQGVDVGLRLALGILQRNPYPDDIYSQQT